MIKINSPIAFSLLLLILWLPLQGQTYLWPTNASTYLSSSFCEYRSGHYHSAIDVKTWLQEGYKCFAVEDGQIEQVRVSPFGYGKVLYLKLNDGQTAVYAHLQRFSDKIEREIRKKQLKNKKYQISWSPENMSVKKGEVVAYTGRTGIGVPHLHFEIRNQKGYPVNPLKYYSEVKDTVRPKLVEIGFVPLTKDSRVDHSARPRIIELKYIRNGVYVLSKPVSAKGKIGLIINGFDQANDVGNKYGFHQSSLALDGKDIFRLTYNELHFETTAHINSEIYYPLMTDQHKIFRKLYIDPYNPLPFYTSYPGEDGSFSVDDRPREFAITVRDFHGNDSVIKGEIMPEQDPLLQVNALTRSDSSIWLDFTAPRLNDLKFFTGESLQKMSGVEYFEIVDGKLSQPADGMKIKFNAPDSGTRFLRIHMKDKDGRANDRIVSLTTPDAMTPYFYFAGNRLILETPVLAAETKLHLNSPGRIYSPGKLPDGVSQYIIPYDDLADHSTRFMLEAGTDSLWSEELNLAVFYPGEQKKVSWFDSAFSMTPGPRTFVDTVIVHSEILEPDSITRVLPVASKIYAIQPGNIPVFQSASVSVKADSLPSGRNWAVFKTNGLNSISYAGGVLDSSRMTFTLKTNPFGNFIIASDTTAPMLEVRNPVNGKSYSGNPRIEFKVSDQYSGIGSEENISLLIDGEFVLPEWDPEDDLVMARIDKPLTRGNHTLSITVRDLSNNYTRRAIIFSVK